MKKTKLLLAMLPFITTAYAAEETVIQEPDMLFYIVPNAQAKEAEDKSAVASDLALAVTRYVPVISPSSLRPSSINTTTHPPIKKRVRHYKTHSTIKKPSTNTPAPINAAVPAGLAPASSAATPCVPATKGQDSIFLRVIK